MPRTYKKPELPQGAKVSSVVPTELNAQELTPKTRVTCVNRGSEPYVDKCDGRDYIVPPGLFEVEYEVAEHFRLRSVVPGSRDPLSGAQENFIAILGIDPPEKCVPFSEMEQARADQAVEALDRGAIEDDQGGARAVVVQTSRARARTAGQGGRRGGVSVEQNETSSGAWVPLPDQPDQPLPEAVRPPRGGDAARASRGEDVE